MGMNLAVALKCCRYVNLHAAVVANDKGGILINAQSGGGKSTLAAALMEEGFRLMSDEFGLLDFDGCQLHGYPRPVSLKDRSINIVTELAGHDWMSERFTDTPKGDIAYRRVRPSDLEAALNPVEAKLIIFPVFGNGAPGVIKRLEPSEVLMRLIPASTNYHLLGERAFVALTNMVKSCQAFEIQYGSTSTSLEIMKDLARRAGL
jgi:HprK-related kinase A